MTGPRMRTDELTPRESDVFELLAEGASNLAAAQILGVSERAIEKVVTRLFDKLDLPLRPDTNRRVLAALEFYERQRDMSAIR